jgi:RsiW-degrading membrane proteinase PrsW (M82 family)
MVVFDVPVRWRSAVERWRRRHPQRAAQLRRAWIRWTWASAVLGLLSLLLVPSALLALPPVLGCTYAVWQVFLLARSKTVSWADCGRALAVGSLLLGPLGVVGASVWMAASHLRPADPIAATWIAALVEETLKIAPILVILVFARSRARRMAAVDYGLIGFASGAGYQVAEDAVRRVTATLPPNFYQTLQSSQYHLIALLPGWSQRPSGLVFPGHFLTAGIVGATVGVVVHLWSRRRAWIVVLPLAAWALVVVDHAAYNAYGIRASDVPMPSWLQMMHQLWGNGSEVTPLFLLLMLIATVLDYRVLIRIAALPTLPARLPVIVQDPTGAGRRAAAVRAGLAAARAAWQELAVTLVALRGSPSTYFGTLQFLRDRRAEGYTLARSSRSDPCSELADVNRRLRAGLAAALAAVVLVVTVAGRVGAPLAGPGAFFASLLDQFGQWWESLSPLAQAMALAGITAWGVALGGTLAFSAGVAAWTGLAADNARFAARFLQDPSRTIAEITPAQVVMFCAQIAVAEIVPRAVGAVLGATERAALGDVGRVAGGAEVDVESVAGKAGGGGGSAPARKQVYIPYDESGKPIPLERWPRGGKQGADMPKPLKDAIGPHTVIGGKISGKTGEAYRQTAEFPGPSWPKVDGVDAPTHSTDWSDHGTPQHHADPHVHGYYFDRDQRKWFKGPPQGTFWPQDAEASIDPNVPPNSEIE